MQFDRNSDGIFFILLSGRRPCLFVDDLSSSYYSRNLSLSLSLEVIYSAFPTFEIIIYKFIYEQCWNFNVFLPILDRDDKDYIHGYIECEIVPLKEIQKKINLNVRKEGKRGNNFIKISNRSIWLYDIIK